MRLSQSVLVATLLVGGCAGGALEDVGPTAGESPPVVTEGPSLVVTEAAATDAYVVGVEVRYAQRLRVPGSGYVLREINLAYAMEATIAPGEAAPGKPSGVARWTVRCYPDKFTTGLEPAAVFAGDHDAIWDWTQADFRRSAELAPDVDWIAGPASGLVIEEGRLQILHQLPAALALDQEVGCPGEDHFTALTITKGAAAMLAPGAVINDAGELSRAEALNGARGEVVYVVAGEPSGWVVHEVALQQLAAGPVDFTFEESSGPESEGGSELTITGSIRTAG